METENTTEDTSIVETDTTDADIVGSDTENAEVGTETESVAPDSLAGGEDSASQDDGGRIPRSRLNEVIGERNSLRDENSAYRERELLNLRAQQEPVQPQSQEPIFDQDTENNLEKWYEQRQRQDRAGYAKLQADFTRSQLRAKNSDYDELEPKLGEMYSKMASAGFTGEEMAQALIDAQRYRSGVPQQKAAQEAVDRQSAKRKAGGPSGVSSVQTQEDTTTDIDGMTSQEFNDYMQKVKGFNN